MASGRALTYVQPGTASQILCQVVDKGRWERLLGDGRIGRRPLGAPYAGCRIDTGWGLLRVQLRESDDVFEATTTIAGRPARTYDRLRDDLVHIVALTDDVLHPSAREPNPALRTLEVEATGDDPEEERAVAMRVLDVIVPLLVAEGEPLPDIDEQGNVAYGRTPVAGGFVDLPRPVQALQMCTVLQGELGVPAEEVHVSDTGECRVRDVVAEVVQPRDATDHPDRIAGRPARIQDDPPVVDVRLRDDAEVEVRVSGPDSAALAEQLVSLLVG